MAANDSQRQCRMTVPPRGCRRAADAEAAARRRRGRAVGDEAITFAAGRSPSQYYYEGERPNMSITQAG
jgi:hypothetical protein